MSPRDYEFRPPEPLFSTTSTDATEESAAPLRRRPVGLIALAVAAGLVVVGLVIALVFLWGTPTEPVAQNAAPGAEPETTEIDAVDPSLIGPDATNPPQVVSPGDSIPIDVDADFPNGVTLVAPDYGTWIEQEIINRPGQFTAISPNYSASIEVWQTSVFATPQSDEALTHAQLNRVSDECNSEVVELGEPVTHMLQGEDNTELELLVQKVTNCDGGDLWLAERVMPLSGTRFHIVLWDAYSIDANDELLEKFAEVTFTLG